MADESIKPELLEQTKVQIRKLVAEIAELAESDIQPQEFHVEFLNRAVAAVAAAGGALWLADNSGQVRIQTQIEFRQTGLMERSPRTAPHDALLGWLFQMGQPQIIPPQVAVEGVPGAGNPTTFALICCPLMVDKKVVGMLEVLMDPTRKAASQKSTLRFVSDLCDLASQYLKSRQSRQLVSQQKLWNQLENFAHAAHASLDLKETAYAIANEGKRLVGCDRLSVAMKLGGKTMVEATSGQEVVEQRSNLIRELNRLCKLVIQSGEDLVYSGHTETFPPDIRDALEIYIDESGAKAVVITLLFKPVEEDEDGKQKERVPFGCLIAEQIGDEMPMTDAHAKTEVVARHASSALWNAQEHNKIFLLPVLKAIGSPWRFFRGRTGAKILAVIGAVLAVIGIMAFVPWELTIEGKGSLLTDFRQNTYAPVSGRVKKVFVKHGQPVKKGDLLVELYSPELDKEKQRLVEQRNNAELQIANLQKQLHDSRTKSDDKPQIQGQEKEAEIKLESAEKQLETINEQLALMQVRAPFDGIVTTWDPQKEFTDRPVEIGTPLISLADTEGRFILEVEIPDNHMGPVLAAKSKLDAAIAAGTKPADERLDAYFVTAADPEHKYPGKVRQIATTAETVESKHSVKAIVEFDPKIREEYQARGNELRYGSEVRTRIKCGQARLSYVLLRDVLQVWYETVMFRWPFLRNETPVSGSSS